MQVVRILLDSKTFFSFCKLMLCTCKSWTSGETLNLLFPQHGWGSEDSLSAPVADQLCWGKQGCIGILQSCWQGSQIEALLRPGWNQGTCLQSLVNCAVELLENLWAFMNWDFQENMFAFDAGFQRCKRHGLVHRATSQPFWILYVSKTFANLVTHGIYGMQTAHPRMQIFCQNHVLFEECPDQSVWDTTHPVVCFLLSTFWMLLCLFSSPLLLRVPLPIFHPTCGQVVGMMQWHLMEAKWYKWFVQTEETLWPIEAMKEPGKVILVSGTAWSFLLHVLIY